MEKIGLKVLQEIYSHNPPFQSIPPITFVKFIHGYLQEKFSCVSKRGMHNYSSKCNDRLCDTLCTLSALQACFEYSFEKRSNSSANNVDDGSNSNTVLNKSSNNETRLNINHSQDSACEYYRVGVGDDISDSTTPASTRLTGNWYNHVTSLLTTDDTFTLQLLSLQEACNCLFLSHTVKKIVCLIVNQYDKIAMVLKHIEGIWRRSNNTTTNLLELINALLSGKQDNDEKFAIVREQVYSWLERTVSSFHNSAFVQELIETDNRNYQKNMLILSILGKLFKYQGSKRKEIPTSMVNVALCILDSYHNVFFLSISTSQEQAMCQLMLIKYMKVLNNLFHLQSGLEMIASPSNVVLNSCHRILQQITPLFDACVKNGYLTTISFCEIKRLGDNKMKNDSDSEYSNNFNVVLAREIFLLATKSCAILSSEGGYLKGVGISSIQTVLERFELWFIEHCNSQALKSGLMPVLLGDQDDKWISALYNMLIIFCQNVSLTDGLISSSIGKSPSLASNENDKGTASTKKQILETFPSAFYPHKLFLQFVKFICFDHLVLSDFLMSPETNFLEYFTKYLTYLESSWGSFVDDCHENHEKMDSNQVQKLNENHSISSRNLFSVKEPNGQEDCSCVVASHSFIKHRLKRQSCHHSDPSLKCKLLKADKNIGSLVPYAPSDSDSDSSDTDTSVVKFSRRSKCGYDIENENGLKENLSTAFSSRLSSGEFHCALDLGLSSALCEDDTIAIGTSINDNLNDKKVMLSMGTNISDNEKCSSQVRVKGSEEAESFPLINDNEEIQEVTDTLENVMTMLIRLRLHLERLDSRQLIQYKADLLFNVLLSCEEQYEDG